MKKDKIVLTGVQPTGTLHLGNFVGAMKPIIEMSKKVDQSFAFIADLHALNAVHDASKLRQSVTEIAAAYIALGLDISKAIFFRQSSIPQVTELSTLLTNVTPKGLMNRAHSYKDAVQKNIAASQDEDIGINMGLYTYPLLMAADILLYGADIIPVGKDQKQHVEFARDIAGSFNAIYGETFKLPEAFIKEETGLIAGLDGRKMSKSYDNVIPIFDSESELKKKIMRIITDSKLPDEPKNPEENTIFLLYKHFASEKQVAEMHDRFLGGGLGYGDAKKMLFTAVNDYLAPSRDKYNELMKHPDTISDLLNEGATRARPIATDTIAKVRKIMGL